MQRVKYVFTGRVPAVEQKAAAVPATSRPAPSSAYYPSNPFAPVAAPVRIESATATHNLLLDNKETDLGPTTKRSFTWAPLAEKFGFAKIKVENEEGSVIAEPEVPVNLKFMVVEGAMAIDTAINQVVVVDANGTVKRFDAVTGQAVTQTDLMTLTPGGSGGMNPAGTDPVPVMPTGSAP